MQCVSKVFVGPGYDDPPERQRAAEVCPMGTLLSGSQGAGGAEDRANFPHFSRISQKGFLNAAGWFIVLELRKLLG